MLSTQIVSGESNSVSTLLSEEWINNKLPDILEGYEPRNIYNADEFGLFYKMLPKKSLYYKGKQCKGGKLSKVRITGYLCTNMDGSAKQKLVIIGKYEKPRCFKKVKKLPVIYYNNSAAWMTKTIFEGIITKFNKKILKEERNVLLFIDNCSSHMLSKNFSNVKIVYLPPNTTSLLQPLDQGVIRSFKSHYKSKLVRKFLHIIREAKSKPNFDKQTFKIQFDLLDAVILSESSWDCVTQNTIINCFSKSGFVFNDAIVNSNLNENFDECNENLKAISDELLEQMVSLYDDSLKTSDIYRENEISHNDIYESETEIESVSEDEDFEIDESNITTSEVLNMLRKINRYFVSRESVPENAFKLTNMLEDAIYGTVNMNLKQKSITHYFKAN